MVGHGCSSTQCLVVGRWAHGLGRVGWWVLRRIGCCWHPWLGRHGVVSLIGWSRIAGWHARRLRVRSVHHRGRCGRSYHRTWSAAHLVQTAAGTGKANNDGDHGEHKDGQADSKCCSKTGLCTALWARRLHILILAAVLVTAGATAVVGTVFKKAISAGSHAELTTGPRQRCQ